MDVAEENIQNQPQKLYVKSTFDGDLTPPGSLREEGSSWFRAQWVRASKRYVIASLEAEYKPLKEGVIFHNLRNGVAVERQEGLRLVSSLWLVFKFKFSKVAVSHDQRGTASGTQTWSTVTSPSSCPFLSFCQLECLPFLCLGRGLSSRRRILGSKLGLFIQINKLCSRRRPTLAGLPIRTRESELQQKDLEL